MLISNYNFVSQVCSRKIIIDIILLIILTNVFNVIYTYLLIFLLPDRYPINYQVGYLGNGNYPIMATLVATVWLEEK